MRDGLLRVREVAALVWEDIEFMPDGCGLLHIRRSKTDQKGEGKTQLLSPLAVKDLRAAIPHGPMDPQALVFGISADWLGRRIRQVCEHVGLEPGYSGHSCRVGMAQDLAAVDIGMAVLMESGRWGSDAMLARYTRSQEAYRGAIARFYVLGPPLAGCRCKQPWRPATARGAPTSIIPISTQATEPGCRRKE